MTHVKQVRAVLERGESITSLDALRRFGCSRLAAVVHTLNRRDGMQIESRIVEIPTASGRASHVAKYSLKQDA